MATKHLTSTLRSGGLTGDYQLADANSASLLTVAAFLEGDDVGTGQFWARVVRLNSGGTVAQTIKDWFIFGTRSTGAGIQTSSAQTLAAYTIGATEYFAVQLAAEVAGGGVTYSGFFTLAQGDNTQHTTVAISAYTEAGFDDEAPGRYSNIYYGDSAHDAVMTDEEPPPPPAPDPPSNVASSKSADRITATFTPSAGSTGTKVYVGTATGPTTLVTTLGAGVGTWESGDVASAATYYIRFKAVGAGGDSGYSSETSQAMAAPSAPTNLAVVFDTDTATLTWTKPSYTSGFKVYASATDGFTPGAGNLVATLGDVATYDHVEPEIATRLYWKVVATNTVGASAAPSQVSARTWRLVSATGATTKYTFSDADTVDAGGDIFGGTLDLTRIQNAQERPVYDTGAGYAIVLPQEGRWPGDPSSSMFVNTWAAHDKNQTFEVEAEVFIDLDLEVSAIDCALVWYPREQLYAHIVRPDGAIDHPGYPTTGGISAYGGHDFSPTTSLADWNGKWVPVRYRYEVISGAAYLTGSCYIDGTWRSSGQFQIAADLDSPHPTVAFQVFPTHEFTGDVAVRNMKVIEGSLAAYSVAPSRVSGTMAVFSVKIDGETEGWTFDGNTRKWTLSGVSILCPPDGTAKFYITNGSTNRVVAFPVANIPDDLWASKMEFRAKHVDWKMVDENGTTLVSGTVGSTEVTTSVDLTTLANRIIQPIITLKNDTSLVGWLDLAWTTTPPATPFVIDAAGTATGSASLAFVVPFTPGAVSAAVASATAAFLAAYSENGAGSAQANAAFAALITEVVDAHGGAVTSASLVTVLDIAASSLGVGSAQALLDGAEPQIVEFAASAIAAASATAQMSELMPFSVTAVAHAVASAAAQVVVTFVRDARGTGTAHAYSGVLEVYREHLSDGMLEITQQADGSQSFAYLPDGSWASTNLPDGASTLRN